MLTASLPAVTQVVAQLNTSDSLFPASASDMCDSWTEGQNLSPGYGNNVALPARQVRVSCGTPHGSKPQYNCSSSPDAVNTNITDFWSTNTLDDSGVALARLVLQVGVQDDLGQVVTAGQPVFGLMQAKFIGFSRSMQKCPSSLRALLCRPSLNKLSAPRSVSLLTFHVHYRLQQQPFMCKCLLSGMKQLSGCAATTAPVVKQLACCSTPFHLVCTLIAPSSHILHSNCTFMALSRHLHCNLTAHSLHLHDTFIAPLLHLLCTFTATSLHFHCTLTAP